MFSRLGKKKTTRKEIPPPINPNIEGFLNNASRIQQARQTSVVGHVDPGNSIMAGPSAPSPSSTSAQALPQASGRSRISSSVSIGQDQAFNEVCKFLNENGVGIVGIYGMGGAGKTTLTKKIWYEFLGPNNFKVLSIVVSKVVNVDRIQQDIMKEMGLAFQKDVHPHRRARDINEAIASSRRKLALLFDDIWEALDLYEIGVLGEKNVNASIFKIIFTTRLEDVCSQMQPDREIKIQPLGWDDSWALFAKHVGTKTLHSSHDEILDLAKSVAKECKGLPLALIVIGKAMTCKYTREAWVDALYNLQKSPSKYQGSEERLFSILKMSYDNIQNDVEKKCFLFCCLYPKDWRIDRQELVEFWIGDGILDLDGSYHDTRNRGHAIIGRLLVACLLELKDEDYLTMHDIIRDMGLRIAGESKFFVHGERLKLTKDEIRNRWEKANGMYVFKGDDLPEQPHCRNLSTLIFDRPMIPKLKNSFLQFMDKLRILKMDNLTFLDTAFEIVGQFVELRWLSICFTNLESFPSELGNLRKLNVLCITLKEQVDSLLLDIGQLGELRKLKITGHTSIKVMPWALRESSKLEELVLPTGADRNCFINPIPNGIFEHTCELRRLELSVTSGSMLPADLWNLSKLEYLHIKGLELVAKRDGENIDSLPPTIGQLRELRKLCICGHLSIKMLPLELGKLSKLEELVLPNEAYNNCFINLIPNGLFEHMRELRRLELCVTSVGILLAHLWNLSKLEHLRINSQLQESLGFVAEREGMDVFDSVSINGLKQLSKSLRTLVMKRWPIFKWANIGSALETMNEMSELSIEEFPVDEMFITSKRLEKLFIAGCCRLVKLQVGGNALKCLCSLTITICDSLKCIIGLEHLEHLKCLEIKDCRKLEGELMNRNEGIRCFPHLKSLSLCSLQLVTTICSDDVTFPSLSDLFICQCEKLEKFPKGLMNEKRPLQGKIEGTKEWWEGLQWEGPDFKSYLLPLL